MRYFFFIALVFTSIFSLAQNPSGCIVYPYNAGVGMYAGKVFTLRNGNVPNSTSTSSPFIATDIRGKEMYDGGVAPGLGPNTPVDINCYRQPTNTANRECAIRFQTSNAMPAVYSYYGGLLAQNYYQCPLDDYILFLILPLGAFGFYMMRKRILLNLA